jgi:hypothetical protein
MGGNGETVGSRYATNKRRHGGGDDDVLDEFELHTKNHDQTVVTRVHAAGESLSSKNSSVEEIGVGGGGGRGRGRGGAGAVGGRGEDGVPSDSNSEEIILQKQDSPGSRGIMISRDVTVRYSSK